MTSWRLVEQIHSQGAGQERILYAEVEYRNRSHLEHLYCAARQWQLYAAEPALLQYMIDYLHPRTAEIRVENVEYEEPHVEPPPIDRDSEAWAREIAARRNGEYPRD